MKLDVKKNTLGVPFSFKSLSYWQFLTSEDQCELQVENSKNIMSACDPHYILNMCLPYGVDGLFFYIHCPFVDREIFVKCENYSWHPKGVALAESCKNSLPFTWESYIKPLLQIIIVMLSATCILVVLDHLNSKKETIFLYIKHFFSLLLQACLIEQICQVVSGYFVIYSPLWLCSAFYFAKLLSLQIYLLFPLCLGINILAVLTWKIPKHAITRSALAKIAYFPAIIITFICLIIDSTGTFPEYYLCHSLVEERPSSYVVFTLQIFVNVGNFILFLYNRDMFKIMSCENSRKRKIMEKNLLKKGLNLHKVKRAFTCYSALLALEVFFFFLNLIGTQLKEQAHDGALQWFKDGRTFVNLSRGFYYLFFILKMTKNISQGKLLETTTSSPDNE